MHVTNELRTALLEAQQELNQVLLAGSSDDDCSSGRVMGVFEYGVQLFTDEGIIDYSLFRDLHGITIETEPNYYKSYS